MTQIDKGKISSFEPETDRNGDSIKARVLPATAQSMPTRPLVISWHLRGVMGNLQIGDNVWFALSNDLTGIILERVDGEWTGIIPGNVTVTGNQTTQGNTTVVGNVSASDVTTSGVASLNGHVHGNGNDGADTTAPTG